MTMDSICLRAGTLTLLLGTGSICFFPVTPTRGATVRAQNVVNRSPWIASGNLGVFSRKMVKGRAVCLEATTEQVRSLRERSASLTVLNPEVGTAPRRGLKIILRGTSQMQNSPAAIQAFERAAARWESVIQTVSTIVIDVD